jgi:hypothetical protein
MRVGERQYGMGNPMAGINHHREVNFTLLAPMAPAAPALNLHTS